MHPLYTEQQLQSKKLTELKAIYVQIGATVEVADKRCKSGWVSAILSAQPQPVKELTEVKPVATCTDCPHFQSHNDGTDKGWCCLFDRFAREHHTMTQDCINFSDEVVDLVDDYLFHGEVQQPVNLPVVGKTHFVGSTLLRCIEIGTEYAAVWDVINDGLTMGEIRMNWDCFWSHGLSLKSFATPQEATADLIESASELVKKPELEVTPTDSLNVFTVTNHRSGNQYKVCLGSNSCTCPHWAHRHTQAGFKDKHIEAAIVFALASPIPTKTAAQIEQEHADAWDNY